MNGAVPEGRPGSSGKSGLVISSSRTLQEFTGELIRLGEAIRDCSAVGSLHIGVMPAILYP
jgi:hypothetical protein